MAAASLASLTHNLRSIFFSLVVKSYEQQVEGIYVFLRQSSTILPRDLYFVFRALNGDMKVAFTVTFTTSLPLYLTL